MGSQGSGIILIRYLVYIIFLHSQTFIRTPTNLWVQLFLILNVDCFLHNDKASGIVSHYALCNNWSMDIFWDDDWAIVQLNEGPLQISICSEVRHVADTSLVMQGRAPSLLNNSAQRILQIPYNSKLWENIFHFGWTGSNYQLEVCFE